MNLLFPAMLAGLVALSIPIALHLIARHKFPVRDFPTLRLLTRDERTNVFAPKLVDPWQLLLRLLVLLFLALAMTRLFFPWLDTPAPRNLVLVIDASASMRQTVKNPDGGGQIPLLDLAIIEARRLLAEVNPPSQSALIVSGTETRTLAALQPGHANALAALPLTGPDQIHATDGSGEGLLHAISTAADLVRGRRETASQIVVLSDLRASSLSERNQKDLERLARVRTGLGERLELILVDLADVDAENVAITSTHVRGRSVKVGDDAHIITHLRNSGTKEARARLQLSVGSQADPALTEITLEPGAEAVVDLTTPINRSVRTLAEARLKDPDSLISDDTSVVALNVAENRRVLIVNGATDSTESHTSTLGELGQSGAAPQETEEAATVDGATILRYALNPGRELGRAGGTGIEATVIAPDALANQTLSKFEIIVLSDVTQLPAQAQEDLATFVREGRSLLILCSAGINVLQFNRQFFSADPQQSGLSPARIGNDVDLNPAVSLDLNQLNHPWLATFRDPLQGDLSAIQFTKIRDLPELAANASIILNSTEGRPLAVEMPFGRGRVILFAFSLEMNRGNLARSRVFPTLMWRLVDHLTGQLRPRPPDTLTTLKPAVLEVTEPGFAFATELELTPLDPTNGSPIRLTITPEQTVLLPPLPAGQYQLHKPRTAGAAAGYSRNISIQMDPRESDFTRLNEADAKQWLGVPVRILALAETSRIAPTGGEFWKFFVWLLVLVYLAEAFMGYALSARREKLRTAEGTP